MEQIPNDGEWAMLEWWEENEGLYPNLAVMARQYLGCPATSATVERLFSRVGISFAKKRRSAGPATLADLAFANANLP